MRIDWWTLGLQTVNVLILVWILSRFLFRPVVAILEERRATAARLLDDAKTTKAQATAAREAAEAEAALNRGWTGRGSSAGRRRRLKFQRLAALAAARAEVERLRAGGRD